MSEIYQFPYEAYLEIENEPFFQARIVVNKVSKGYHADIDIIMKENQRIYKHVGSVFEGIDAQDVFDSAVYKLSTFLQGEEGK
ncbi:MAG: hypothetical protein ACOYL6_18465 [Bacteriovoracaceae bacterium]